MEPFEPPKYLEKLIAAVNDGAKSAQLGALAFTAIGVFLLATAFSATDEDLLLNRALTISQLGGTAVPVVFAFGLAPAVFVAAHFYTLIRYDMLAGNVRRFREDLAVMVRSEEDRDRCRQLLANVEFVNALAMPKGSRASSRMFAWTVRMLLAVFPVAVLLIVQLQSLRLQSEWVTWTHHACIAADLVLLVWFFGRLRGDSTGHFWTTPIRRPVALSWMPLMVITADLAWLQVPGPDSETPRNHLGLTAHLRDYPASASFMEQVRWWASFQPVDALLCTPGAWGCRCLTVRHRIIVAKVWDTTTFVALRAGAEVDAKHRSSFEAASLSERTLRFADLTDSELFAVNLVGADLRGAYLTRTKLQGADLTWAQLQGGDLDWAELEGANLRGANLHGARLSSAQLQGADLAGADLHGVNLSSAQLQGARLSRTQLQGADLTRANLQGADLEPGLALGRTARLKSQLQGADLRRAQLQGANLQGVELQGATLRGAGLWNVTTDENTRLGLADLRDAHFDNVLAEDMLPGLHGATPEGVRQRLRERLVAKPSAGTLPKANTTDGKILVSDRDYIAWRGLDRERQLTTETTDIDPALAKLLADTVAPTSPRAAEIAAERVTFPGDTDKQRPLIKLLGCRLQAQAEAKRVTLSAKTIDLLRKATGPCDPASQQ